MEKKGMQIERYFSREGENPFETSYLGGKLEYETRQASIKDDKGKIIFTQDGVEVPKQFSQLATDNLAAKYFYGEKGKSGREYSLKQVVGRISDFISQKGLERGYFSSEKDALNFRDDLIVIMANQAALFNSPVLFNCGVYDRYGIESGSKGHFRHDLKSDKIVPLLRGESYKYPQAAACFIKEVLDDMESISANVGEEMMLFKHGSGVGADLSYLRSTREKLSGGGTPSGPLSFMKIFDRGAGVVKSGGKTRRAARMQSLGIWHPDILEFIRSKAREEEKAGALMKAGYSGGMDGEAYDTVHYQNTNISVRVTDEFMKAVKERKKWKTTPVHNKELTDQMPEYDAYGLLMEIAEAAKICGDPGLQYHDTINRDNTCTQRPIRASNPCVTGDTKVLTEDGKWARIDSIIGKKQKIIVNNGTINEVEIEGSFKTGKKPVYRLQTESGFELKLTADHKVFTINRGFVQACELTKDDFILLPATNVANIYELEEKERTFYQMVGVYLGDGSSGEINNHRGIALCMHAEQERAILERFAESVALNYSRITHKNSPATIQIAKTSCKYVITNSFLMNAIADIVDLKKQSHEKCFSEKIFNLNLSRQKYILQGLFTADGTVANYGDKSKYVSLDSTSLQLLKDTQILLSGFGIKSKIYTNRRAGKNESFLPDGKGGYKKYKVKEMHSLRISKNSRLKFEKLIGFMPESPKTAKLKKLNQSIETYKEFPIDAVSSLTYIGIEDVYDLTEPKTHTFVANGITIHNCSEYMFWDNSACNLASINLVKMMDENGNFNTDRFEKVIRRILVAQEILVDSTSYPSKEIAENTHLTRSLGLGYANLGAALMRKGLSYDSEEGRAWAAAVTAIMGGTAYKVSSEMAQNFGAFIEYDKNKESMLEVIANHGISVKKIDESKLSKEDKILYEQAEKSWKEAKLLGEKNGFRNAQVTVLAPTGTTGLMMDCDTTGIEPDIALVKYKQLAGGGMKKIVNQSVGPSLLKMGYNSNEISDIIKHIDENDTIEGAPHLKEEDLKVFDCAFKPKNGKRCISYEGHIRMMAAVQPYLSGAISKTVNMPAETTAKEIADAYILGHELGLKALAIFPDGAKNGGQPVTTSLKNGDKKLEDKVEIVKEEIWQGRKKLPQTRYAITHKFTIGINEHPLEGYITAGMYDNGRLGEVFINTSKEGSTVGGLIDGFATAISLELQKGTSLDDLVKKFSHSNFPPSGLCPPGEILGKLDKLVQAPHECSSIYDYLFQWLDKTFPHGHFIGDLPGQVATQNEKQIEDKEHADAKTIGGEGLICPFCGGPAVRKGRCDKLCVGRCGKFMPGECGGP
jgi:ribonucleoside-diphosphate reductase alpha chain